MGSKFQNINIQGAAVSEIEGIYQNGEIHPFVPGWVTVTSEEFTYTSACDAAKKLSKLVPYPVLATDYFDDSYVEFAVFRCGKRAARHVPQEYEEFRRKPGKAKEWIEALGLPAGQEKMLQMVFRETDPETSLHLLAVVLQCVLWADSEEARMPEPQFLEDYVRLKNAEKKIKNKTKLVLLDEVFDSYWIDDHYPILRYGPNSPKNSCLIIRDGKFVEVDAKDYGHLLKGVYLDEKHFFTDGICQDAATGETLWTLPSLSRIFPMRAPLPFSDGRFCMNYIPK